VEPRKARSRTWFRAHRTFRSEDLWYFHTCEGIGVGPFRTEFEARIEASILNSLLKDADDQAAAVSAVREFLLDARTPGRELSALADYIERAPGFSARDC
jgi:hypothetical protein